MVITAVLASVLAAVGLWLFIAGLTEAITEIIKTAFDGKIKGNASYVLSIVVGVGLAIAFGLNPFGLAGAGAWVSMIAAGILASRGANYLNGLLKKLGIIQ